MCIFKRKTKGMIIQKNHHAEDDSLTKANSHTFDHSLHRSFDRSFDRSLEKTFDRPYEKHIDHSFNTNSERIHEKNIRKSLNLSLERTILKINPHQNEKIPNLGIANIPKKQLEKESSGLMRLENDSKKVVNISEDDKIEMPTSNRLVKFYKSVIRPHRDKSNMINPQAVDSSRASSIAKQYQEMVKNDPITRSRKIMDNNDLSIDKSQGTLADSIFNSILGHIKTIKEEEIAAAEVFMKNSKASINYINQIKELQKCKNRCKKAEELHHKYNELIGYIPINSSK